MVYIMYMYVNKRVELAQRGLVLKKMYVCMYVCMYVGMYVVLLLLLVECLNHQRKSPQNEVTTKISLDINTKMWQTSLEHPWRKRHWLCVQKTTLILTVCPENDTDTDCVSRKRHWLCVQKTTPTVCPENDTDTNCVSRKRHWHWLCVQKTTLTVCPENDTVCPAIIKSQTTNALSRWCPSIFSLYINTLTTLWALGWRCYYLHGLYNYAMIIPCRFYTNPFTDPY